MFPSYAHHLMLLLVISIGALCQQYHVGWSVLLPTPPGKVQPSSVQFININGEDASDINSRVAVSYHLPTDTRYLQAVYLFDYHPHPKQQQQHGNGYELVGNLSVPLSSSVHTSANQQVMAINYMKYTQLLYGNETKTNREYYLNITQSVLINTVTVNGTVYTTLHMDGDGDGGCWLMVVNSTHHYYHNIQSQIYKQYKCAHNKYTRTHILNLQNNHIVYISNRTLIFMQHQSLQIVQYMQLPQVFTIMYYQECSRFYDYFVMDVALLCRYANIYEYITSQYQNSSSSSIKYTYRQYFQLPTHTNLNPMLASLNTFISTDTVQNVQNIWRLPYDNSYEQIQYTDTTQALINIHIMGYRQDQLQIVGIDNTINSNASNVSNVSRVWVYDVQINNQTQTQRVRIKQKYTFQLDNVVGIQYINDNQIVIMTKRQILKMSLISSTPAYSYTIKEQQFQFIQLVHLKNTQISTLLLTLHKTQTQFILTLRSSDTLQMISQYTLGNNLKNAKIVAPQKWENQFLIIQQRIQQTVQSTQFYTLQQNYTKIVIQQKSGMTSFPINNTVAYGQYILTFTQNILLFYTFTQNNKTLMIKYSIDYNKNVQEVVPYNMSIQVYGDLMVVTCMSKGYIFMDYYDIGQENWFRGRNYRQYFTRNFQTYGQIILEKQKLYYLYAKQSDQVNANTDAQPLQLIYSMQKASIITVSSLLFPPPRSMPLFQLVTKNAINFQHIPSFFLYYSVTNQSNVFFAQQQTTAAMCKNSQIQPIQPQNFGLQMQFYLSQNGQFVIIVYEGKKSGYFQIQVRVIYMPSIKKYHQVCDRKQRPLNVILQDKTLIITYSKLVQIVQLSSQTSADDQNLKEFQNVFVDFYGDVAFYGKPKTRPYMSKVVLSFKKQQKIVQIVPGQIKLFTFRDKYVAIVYKNTQSQLSQQTKINYWRIDLRAMWVDIGSVEYHFQIVQMRWISQKLLMVLTTQKVYLQELDKNNTDYQQVKVCNFGGNSSVDNFSHFWFSEDLSHYSYTFSSAPSVIHICNKTNLILSFNTGAIILQSTFTKQNSLHVFTKENRIFVLKMGKCPQKYMLKQGYCLCEQNRIQKNGKCECSDTFTEKQDKCICQQGNYINDKNQCTKCGYPCSECQSDGKCTKYSAGFIALMVILGIIGFVVLVGAVILVLKKWGK